MEPKQAHKKQCFKQFLVKIATLTERKKENFSITQKQKQFSLVILQLYFSYSEQNEVEGRASLARDRARFAQGLGWKRNKWMKKRDDDDDPATNFVPLLFRLQN